MADQQIEILDNKILKYILLIIVFLFILFIIITAILTKGIVPDDSYITLRYSKNLFKYHQFTYNLEDPTYSLTTPLWAILIACFGWISKNFVILAQIISILLSLIAAIFLYKLSKYILGDSYALFPVFLFLLDPYLIGANYCGTEMALFSLLGIIFVYFIININFKLSQYTLAALSLSLLIMTRPEGFVIFIISCLYILMFFYYREGINAVLFITVITLLILTPWLVYAYLTFKTIIPTSVILKSIDSSKYLPFSDFISIKRFVLLIIKGYLPYISIITIGIIILFYNFKKQKFVRAYLYQKKPTDNRNPFLKLKINSVQILPSMLVFGLIVFYLAGLKEKAISSRYLVTFSPYLMIMTVQFLIILSKKINNYIKSLIIYIIIIFLMILTNIGAISSRARRSIIVDAPRVITGQWIARNICKTSTIANFGGAGGIAYYFDGKVWDYDLISLMGKDIEFAKKRRQGFHIEANEYLYKNPDYFVVPLESNIFDSMGNLVYQNQRYKIINITQK